MAAQGARRSSHARVDRHRGSVVVRSGPLPPPIDRLEMVGMTLIVDDIVMPDGSRCILFCRCYRRCRSLCEKATAAASHVKRIMYAFHCRSSMGRLGGGGPQTLWGFQLQRGQVARVGLAAGVGPDLPQECRRWLEQCSIDTAGLVVHEGGSTPRAWQILEEDGRRHEIWRTPFTEQLVRMLRPPLADLPPAYRLAGSYHLGVHPQDPSLPLLRELRAAAGDQGGRWLVFLCSCHCLLTAAARAPSHPNHLPHPPCMPAPAQPPNSLAATAAACLLCRGAVERRDVCGCQRGGASPRHSAVHEPG